MRNIGYTFERACRRDLPGAGESVVDIWRAPQLWNGEASRRNRFADEADALDRWRAQAVERDGPFMSHFRTDGRPRDTLVVEAGEAPGVYLARLDLDELRAYRQRETWGNAFRQPQLYGAPAETRVAPPFVRVDGAGERWDASRRAAR